MSSQTALVLRLVYVVWGSYLHVLPDKNFVSFIMIENQLVSLN